MEKNIQDKIVELKSLVELKGISSNINMLVKILKEISLDNDTDLLNVLDELDTLGFDKEILLSSLEMKTSFLDLEKSIYETLILSITKDKVDDKLMKRLIFLIGKKEPESVFANRTEFTNEELLEIVDKGKILISSEIDRIDNELVFFDKIETLVVG